MPVVDTSLAVCPSTVIASILASIARRWRWTNGPITTATTVLYTIPAIALFAALIPVFGIGYTVPAIALTTALSAIDVAGKPVYLGMMMNAEQLLRLKPQNLLLNLPLARES